MRRNPDAGPTILHLPHRWRAIRYDVGDIGFEAVPHYRFSEFLLSPRRRVLLRNGQETFVTVRKQ